MACAVRPMSCVPFPMRHALRANPPLSTRSRIPSGIGKEFAEEFASRGMSVLLVSRTKARLVEQAEELMQRFKVDTKYMVSLLVLVLGV